MEIWGIENSGGEGGIRTPGTRFSAYNGLANRRLQPLGHLSADGSAEKTRPDALSITLMREGRRGQLLQKWLFPADYFPLFCVKENGSIVSKSSVLRERYLFPFGVLNDRILHRFGASRLETGMMLAKVAVPVSLQIRRPNREGGVPLQRNISTRSGVFTVDLV